MKLPYLFLLFLLPSLCFGQSESSKIVVYRLDTIASDSFYLLEKSFVPSGGRRDTLANYILFRDTASFGAFYRNLAQQADGLTKKIDFLTAERDSVRARANRLAVLSTALSNFLSSAQNRSAAPAQKIEAPLKIEAVKPVPTKPPDKKKKKKQ